MNNEYTAYREGYSDGFNDGIKYMQDLFIQNQKDAEERQAKRFSEWRKMQEEKYKAENEGKRMNCKDCVYSDIADWPKAKYWCKKHEKRCEDIQDCQFENNGEK